MVGNQKKKKTNNMILSIVTFKILPFIVGSIFGGIVFYLTQKKKD